MKGKCLSRSLIFIILICIVSACATRPTIKNSQERKEEEKMQGKHPISDFERLINYELPVSEGNQSVGNISKIYFGEVIDLLGSDIIAIDLQNKVAQFNPRTAHLYGEIEFDIGLSDDDVATVVGILEEGGVDGWNEEYRYGEESMLSEMGGEGYSWTLFIQYNDGTMSIKHGKGVKKEEIQPDGYDVFFEKIYKFMKRKKQG